MKKWLFNPFTYIAGSKALIVGSIIMLVTLFAAYYGNMHFNGAIDAHFGSPQPFVVYLLEQVIAWGSLVVVFYALAFFLSSSNFRFIDIAGTIAIARAPMFLVAVIGLLSKSYMETSNPNAIDGVVIAIGLLMLLPLIWMIALMYHAFTVSFNLKGTKAVVGFIGGLIFAEIISLLLNKVLQYYIHS